ncbi:hypothetical protein HPP92_021024 [Vanilla planifolia]|uniref:PWWP domain-containing protein n=1 Tax=Vanilla planifolia TaxID=51239 RepID=A0A835UIE1_VANPL|nr:hypothetical protein HPP92_021024 [Vanilla planifolia]
MGFRGIDGCKVGDFVWGKINGQLWWPGQICDPLDASEELRNSLKSDNNVLVFYFGGLTLEWCEPYLLKPFNEEFEQMLEHNSSQSFIAAVKDAMHEMERCLRSDMTCCCVPAEDIARLRIGNKNGLGKASIPNYSPAEFLEHLWNVARDVTIADILEVTKLRSWAASFYLRNGCFVKMIEDLFDEKQSDLNASCGDPVKDKPGQECQIPGGGIVKRPPISEEEPSRKKRSMVEIIGLSDPKLVQHGVEGDKDREIDAEVIEPIKPGLYIAQKRRKKEKEIEKVLNDDVNKVIFEEENGATRRERKKSKYLSPPYTSGYTKRSNSFKLEDTEVSESDSESSRHLYHNFPADIGSHKAFTKKDHPITPSFYNEASSNDLLANLLLVASNLDLRTTFPEEKFRDFFLRHRNFGYSGMLDFKSLSEEHDVSGTFLNQPLHSMIIESNNVTPEETATSVRKNRRILSKVHAAKETRMSSCPSTLNMSKGGSGNKGKRSTDDVLAASMEELDDMTTIGLKEGKIECNGTNGEYKAELDHKMSTSSIKDVSRSKRTKLAEHTVGSSLALLLTFSPSSNLPSKDELLSVFGKYGPLVEHETTLFSDTSCARIVFSRETDAKKALKGIKNSKNLPFPVVDCQSFDLPQCTGVPSPTENSSDAALVYISQDLQRMIHMLSLPKGSTSHVLKPEVRNDLIDDMKGILNKVNNLMAMS